MRFEPKLSVRDYVRRESYFYFRRLESTILTNWVWGPRQNRQIRESIVKPIDKDIFHRENKKLVPRVLTVWKYYIRALLRSVIYLHHTK